MTRRLNSGKFPYHSDECLSCSSLLYEEVKITVSLRGVMLVLPH